MALPSFKREREFLQQTYGEDFSEELANYILKVAEAAERSTNGLCLVPLAELLEGRESVYGGLWSRVKDATTIDRLNALIHFLKNRTPPFHCFATTHRIFALQRIWITVYVVVDVDHARGAVTFCHLFWHGETLGHESHDLTSPL